MTKGISVHVGVNRVDAPGINVPNLKGCENDAIAMHEIAVANGFNAKEALLSEDATFDRVVAEIEEASAQLEDGDIFLCTFSGHGTRRGTNDLQETDFKDESIVLHDRILIDNMFRRVLWPKFKQGVRIFAVSDSCHSEGVFFVPADTEASESQPVAPLGTAAGVATSPALSSPSDHVTPRDRVIPGDRVIPEHQKELHFELLKEFYEKLRATIPSQPPPINASLLLLGACREHEQAKDGLPHGVFTQALLDVLTQQNPADYNVLVTAIQQKLVGVVPQHPVLTPFPPPNAAFLAQRPFSI